MRRRWSVPLWGLLLLVVLAIVGAVSAGWFVTRSERGQRWLAETLRSRFLSPNCRCTWEVASVSGGLLGGVVADSVTIRDERGELFFSATRVHAQYDFRDLLKGRLYFRTVALEDPYVHIRQFENDEWNYKRIFRLGEDKGKAASDGRKAVNLFVLDSVRIERGTMDLSLPWHPDRSLRGAARERAIAEHLGRTDQIFEKTFEGYAHRRRWENANVLLSRVSLIDPDAAEPGHRIDVARLDVDENDPPFQFRNTRGTVRILDDSLWLDIPHFDLPASTGSGTGKIVWGGGLPIRYDLAIRGDSVSLSDVAWVYPTLPRTGGGKLMLHIRNDPRDLDVIDYRLSEMNVRTVGSHLMGEMTFGIGKPVLEVKNVNLVANPVDFDFIRELSGSPFPIDWRGQLFGTVRGRGGPLTNFIVDAAQVEWRDTHVPGAVSRLSGSGALDILDPELTVFRGFRVDVASLDLRSIQYLFPAFPRLNGTIAGVATLDSVWTRVRFREAELAHRDGDGEPSVFAGRGMVVLADELWYDFEGEARRISFDMLRRSFDLPFQGSLSGPLRLRGTASDLELSTNLRGAAGTLSFEGRIDADSAGGYGAHGRGQVAGLDIARLLVDSTTRHTWLNGHYEVDLAGPTPARLQGRLLVDLEASGVDTLRIDRGRANVLFAGGRARLVEPLTMTSRLARLRVTGGIGLPGGTSDSLTFSLRDVNLGELRSYFGSALGIDDSLSAFILQVDSGATVTGRLDSLRVQGRLTGERLAVAGSRARSLRGDFDVELGNAMRMNRGQVTIRADSLLAGGIQFDTASVTLSLLDSLQGTFTLFADAARRPSIAASGNWKRTGETTDLLIESGTVGLPDGEWRLAGPSRVSFDTRTTRIDALSLRDARGGELRMSGNLPQSGTVSLTVTGNRIPLANIADVAQIRGRYDGFARFTASVGGTRLEPVVEVRDATLDSLGTMPGAEVLGFGRASIDASYRTNNLSINVRLLENDRTTIAAHANLPVELTLFSFRNLGDSLSGALSANDASLRVFQPLVAGITLHEGRINGRLDFSGRWTDPRFYGRLAVNRGVMVVDSFYTTYRDIAGTVELHGDSIVIADSIVARSGDRRRVRHAASLKGSIWAKDSLSVDAVTRWKDPSFDLTLWANNFEVMRNPDLMFVEITTDTEPIRLTGRWRRATLGGAVKLPFARLFIAESSEGELQIARFEDFLAANPIAAGDDRYRYGIVDTLVQNLQFADFRLSLGEDVRLRSAETDVIDVKLGGALEIRKMNLIDENLPSILPRAYREIGFYGELQPISGSYNFKLAGGLFPVQRTFAVQNDGYIRFNGPFNPELNVSAKTSVRLSGRQEQRLGIIANLSGRLVDPGPRLNFVAEDRALELSDSDMISYLAFGQPGFALEEGWTRSLVGSGVSGYITDWLRRSVALDALQFEGALANTSFTPDGLTSFLRGGRLSAEQQLGERAFATFSTGLCELFRAPDQFDPNAFAQGLGGSLTYRLSGAQTNTNRVVHTWSVRAALEPPLSAQFCTPGMVALSGLAPMPRQTMFSFLHTWRR